MDIRQIGCFVITALIGFAVSSLAGRWIIPWLHKLHFGQTIREIGPSWHKKKQGTPTMGGMLFLLGMTVALLIAVPVWCFIAPQGSALSVFRSNNTITRFVAGVLLILGCGAIGFADDFIKVVKKRNLGLTERQKLALQLLVAVSYVASLYLAGGSRIHIPFVGEKDLGLWLFPLGIFIIVGATNAVNITDGVDGLCGSITVIALVPLLVLSGYYGAMGQGMIAAALIGGILGFLVWNLHPARVFMGDFGSLALGGALCAVAFGIGQPLLLIPVGIVYICETMSVILQVSYFKLTHGKRLFKMSPIHHHFEMCGWKENTIVAVFSAVTLLGGIAALLLSWYG